MDADQPAQEYRDDGKRIARLPHSSGIDCPQCGCCDTEVLRTTRYTGMVQRERQCLSSGCGHRFITSERITAAEASL